MLDPQVVMNLLPQICVGMELVKHNHWPVSLPWCYGHRVSEQNDWPDGNEDNRPEGSELG